jgi:hypothetical protein
MPLRLFTGVRAETWRRLAEELDADLIERTFFRPFERVVKRVGDWEIVLDSLFEPEKGLQVTRLRAAFMNPEGFRFHIASESPLTPLARLFQLVDEVEIGDHLFDERFVCESNDPPRLKALLIDPGIKRLFDRLHNQPFKLEIVDGGPPFSIGWHDDVDELRFSEYLPAGDLEALKTLFDLFAELLDRICARGRAYDDPIADAALPPGTPGALRAVYGALARATLAFAGRPERVADGVERRLSLDRPYDLEAVVRVTAPALPRNTCDVSLDGALPASELPLPQTGALLQKARVRQDSALVLELDDVPLEQVDGVVDALLQHWQRCVEARAGVTPPAP